MQMKMHQSTYALSFLDVKYTSMHLMKDIRGIGKNTLILILRIESLDMLKEDSYKAKNKNDIQALVLSSLLKSNLDMHNQLILLSIHA
jgi:hypothetical protein